METFIVIDEKGTIYGYYHTKYDAEENALILQEMDINTSIKTVKEDGN